MRHTRYVSNTVYNDVVKCIFNFTLSLFYYGKHCLYHFQVDGTDDKAEYKDTMDAMATMGMDNDEQSDVIQVVTGKTKNTSFLKPMMNYELHVLLLA